MATDEHNQPPPPTAMDSQALCFRARPVLTLVSCQAPSSTAVVASRSTSWHPLTADGEL